MTTPRKLLLTTLFFCIFSSLHAGIPVRDKARMNRWVDSVMQTLTPQEKMAQLIMPMIYPTTQPHALKKHENDVRKYQWGGILYQKGLLAEQRSMDQRLQQLSNIPMLITLDGEWGLYMRLKDAPRYPRNMGLGAHANEQLLYDYGREVARQCRLMGIHADFAPVLDVNNNPNNPVIGTRSFGADPQTVARCAVAYARGLEDGGVLSVGKHFPGHGNTNQDSHKTLPTIRATREQLAETELVPFQQYIDEGLEGMMVAHLRVPSLDPSGTPTSLSGKAVNDLLREEMGFEGLVFTDAMAMAGAQFKGAHANSVMALLAGNDILLAPTNPIQTLRELTDAYGRGVLKDVLINDRCRRVLSYKYKLIIEPDVHPLTPREVTHQVNNRAAKKLQERLWLQSIHFSKPNPALLHALRSGDFKRIAIVTVGGNANAIYPMRFKLHHKADVFPLAAERGRDARKLIDKLKSYDLVLVALYSAKSSTWEALCQIARNQPLVLTNFASPYLTDKMPQLVQKAAAVAQAYEYCAEAEEAAVEALYKEPEKAQSQPARKKVFSVPGLEIVPHESLKKLDEIAEEGVRMGAFPGCQILVIKGNEIVYDKSFGTLTGKDDNHPVTAETYYDLASLTKACVTTPAIMHLVSEGKISLSGTLGSYVPRFRNTPLERITMRQLLLHEAGLMPTINFYMDLVDTTSYLSPLISFSSRNGYIKFASGSWGNPSFDFLESLVQGSPDAQHKLRMAEGIYVANAFKDMMMQRIARTQLLTQGVYRYSDIGFVLLQQVVEEVSKMPLDKYVQKYIFGPIGADLYFNPESHGMKLSQIAPAQIDNFLRKQELRGTVDDETAACLGGVAGNAGLYGNTHELAKLMQFYLKSGKWKRRQIIKREVFDAFVTETGVGKRRNPGFDKPRANANYVADSASPATYGHTGFTGTCFWVDPNAEMAFIFLSNRTYPNRWNNLLMSQSYRRRLHQAAYDAFR